MMDVVYKFLDFKHLAGNPQKVGELLSKIREDNGSLTPAAVLQEATPPTSILHRYFEWDNMKAAHKWRINQAREVIRSVVIVETEGEITTSVKAFVSTGDSYEPIQVVMSYAAMREQVIQDVMVEIQKLRNKIKTFTDLKEVLEGLDQAQQAASKYMESHPNKEGVKA